MDPDLIVAIVAAMLNIVLSLLVPPLLKNSTLPFAAQIKKNYDCNQDIVIVSSVLTVIFVYVSLKITPWVRSNVFTNLAKLSSK
jgi:hypothetical protein